MRCFVTGSTGFIGSYLIRLLLNQDYQVGVLVRPASNLWRIQEVLNRLHIIPGDLAMIDQSAPAILKFAPEVVFHLGWYGVTNRHRNNPSQVSQNLYGSIRLLEIAHEAGCQCWVGLGSQAEYGRFDGKIAEHFQAQPETIYGTAKLCVGLLSQKLCEVYGIRFVWFRLLAAYGPKDDPEHMIPYVILSLLRGQEPALTSGEQQWDYLYVEDAVRAIWKTFTSQTAQGIFNLASGKSLPVSNIVKLIRDLINPDLPLGFAKVPYLPNQIMVLEADISRLQHATGWVPQVPINEGVRLTIDWYKKQKFN
jgi:nucleoside-diphosphate-sugar epimerase